jgi:hypothetical protein
VTILHFKFPAPFLDGGNGDVIAGVAGPRSCPYCGSSHEVEVFESPGADEAGTFHAHCLTCGVVGPPGVTRLDAAVGWNRRRG